MAKIDLTLATKKLLARGLKAIQDDYDFKSNLKKEIWIQNARRGRVAAKFRQGLLQSAFKAANIDQTAIARRKELDSRSVRDNLKTLVPILNDRARSIKQAHADRITMLKTLAKSKLTPRVMGGPPPPPGPNGSPVPATEVVILNKADTIAVSGGAVTSSLTPWNNTIRAILDASSHTTPDTSAFAVRCDFVFLYVPPRAGILHAWAWVASNGSATGAADGLCESPTLVIARASASAVVQQPLATINNQIELPEQLLGPVLDLGSFNPSCSSDYGAQTLDEFLTFETTGMELHVIANTPVQIIVSIFLNGTTWDGVCSLDFQTGQRQINVPAIILNLF
jgi:hypothetical protein